MRTSVRWMPMSSAFGSRQASIRFQKVRIMARLTQRLRRVRFWTFHRYWLRIARIAHLRLIRRERSTCRPRLRQLPWERDANDAMLSRWAWAYRQSVVRAPRIWRATVWQPVPGYAVTERARRQACGRYLCERLAWVGRARLSRCDVGRTLLLRLTQQRLTRWMQSLSDAALKCVSRAAAAQGRRRLQPRPPMDSSVPARSVARAERRRRTVPLEAERSVQGRAVTVSRRYPKSTPVGARPDRP
jgi:hypothetical protein